MRGVMSRLLANVVIAVLVLLIPLCFTAFVVLRDIQLSLPDPYNNPYTNWSTSFLLAVMILWMLGLILTAIWYRLLAAPIWILATVILASTTLFVLWCCAGMLMMVHPELVPMSL